MYEYPWFSRVLSKKRTSKESPLLEKGYIFPNRGEGTDVVF